jgi:hypothetical protein
MAQIKFEKLTKTWKPFAEIVGTVGTKEYIIQNRGSDTLVALEAGTTPSADAPDGIMILPNDIAVYQKGDQNLYLRAFNVGCSINVTEGN